LIYYNKKSIFDSEYGGAILTIEKEMSKEAKYVKINMRHKIADIGQYNSYTRY
jgi:hypothetical protein